MKAGALRKGDFMIRKVKVTLTDDLQAGERILPAGSILSIGECQPGVTPSDVNLAFSKGKVLIEEAFDARPVREKNARES